MFRGLPDTSNPSGRSLAHLQPDESTSRCGVSAGWVSRGRRPWLQLISTGFIQRMSIERFNAEGLDLFFAYMGDEALGGLLIGLVRYQDVSERVYGLVGDDLVGDDHVMFVGIDGGAVAGFRSNRLSIGQGGRFILVPSRRVTFLGTPYEGKAAGQVRIHADHADRRCSRCRTALHGCLRRRGERSVHHGIRCSGGGADSCPRASRRRGVGRRRAGRSRAGWRKRQPLRGQPLWGRPSWSRPLWSRPSPQTDRPHPETYWAPSPYEPAQ